MPTFYMLIGVPASGKSTWRASNAKGAETISTDDIIEKIAASQDKTYNDVFKDNIKAATNIADRRAKSAFDDERDVVWDQTNLTRKSRASKLTMVPKHYKKVAVYFPTPHPEVHKKRLAGRPGKTIPNYVLDSMTKSLEPPTKAEGFDEVIVV
jgi:predicted kinase